MQSGRGTDLPYIATQLSLQERLRVLSRKLDQAEVRKIAQHRSRPGSCGVGVRKFSGGVAIADDAAILDYCAVLQIGLPDKVHPERSMAAKKVDYKAYAPDERQIARNEIIDYG